MFMQDQLNEVHLYIQEGVSQKLGLQIRRKDEALRALLSEGRLLRCRHHGFWHLTSELQNSDWVEGTEQSDT